MTALLGGSFNPVHIGHTGLARWMVEHGYADETWLMVSPHNPLKAARNLADEQSRLQWAALACTDIEGVTASGFEFDLPRPSYTWQTLTALRIAYPNKQFALAIGADNWLCFDRWARHGWILRHFPLLVYPRTGFPIESDNLPCGVTLMPAPLFPYSSTDIRRRLARGEDCADAIPPAALQAILQSGFYSSSTVSH